MGFHHSSFLLNSHILPPKIHIHSLCCPSIFALHDAEWPEAGAAPWGINVVISGEMAKKAGTALAKGTHTWSGRPSVCWWCVRHPRMVSSSCVKPFAWLMPVNSVMIPPKDCKGTSALSFLISCISGNIMSTITLAWQCSIILVRLLIAGDAFKLVTNQAVYSQMFNQKFLVTFRIMSLVFSNICLVFFIFFTNRHQNPRKSV